ncbi:3-isopropylmalate dehydratase small subunit [Streptomyces sp. NPDC058426]|uniref:3-isopropylmalate dehydratase small subunit n=1 Tax=Streptomyces sp. NPDC058426 TaxID=3346493 RepID=UPI00365BA069
MARFTIHRGTAVPLRRSNVDTDQIIPVRFCTRSTRHGHADALFADWRDDPSFALNRHEHQGASVLVAGTDFGTGSSREYAVWALQDYGIRAVIAPRFGEIFRGNAALNGLLTVVVPTEVVESLWAAASADPVTEVTVDLERLEVRWLDRTQSFTFDPEIRRRLMTGLDPIAATLSHAEEIATYERGRRAHLPLTS